MKSMALLGCLVVVANLQAATLYVSLQSTNPVAPYATWRTAANVIQHAVDAAKDGDAVLVGDGVYVVGGRDANRVAVTNAIRLESVNGPMATTIDGGGKVRCVHLGSNGLLSGFTLTNGSAPSGEGGGVLSWGSSVLTNCTLKSNSAGRLGGGAYGGILYNCTVMGNWAASGGGAGGGILYNCTVIGNWAACRGGSFESAAGGEAWCPIYNEPVGGGGAAWCTLYNCTVTGNSAPYGGGVQNSTLYNCTLTCNSAQGGGGSSWCTLYNCTVVANSADHGGGASNSHLLNSIVCYNSGGNYGFGGGLWGDVYGEIAIVRGCCTTPLPLDGVANIEEPPLFMDLALVQA